MTPIVRAGLSLFAAALAAAASPTAAGRPTRISGQLAEGCHALGDIRLCRRGANGILYVGGRATRFFSGYAIEDPTIFEITKIGQAYVVRVGFPSVADTPFFESATLTLARYGRKFSVSKFTDSSAAACANGTIRVVTTADLGRHLLVTEIDRRFAADRYPHIASARLRNAKDADPLGMSLFDYLDLISNGPSDAQLCRLAGYR